MSNEDSFTPDYSLTKPESVTLEDYHRMLDRVDNHLMGRGPIGERPTDMSSDAIWVVTNGDGTIPDNTITRWDSDAGEWAPVGSHVRIDDLSNTVDEKADRVGDHLEPESVAAKAKPWVDVTHTDNEVETGSGDQSSAIQSVFDALGSNTPVLFPPGEYVLGDEVTVSGLSNIHISAYGATFELLDNTAGFTFEDCDNIVFEGGDAVYDQAHNPADCNIINISTGTENATVKGMATDNVSIRAYGASNVLIEACSLVGRGENGAEDAIQILGTENAVVSNNRIENWNTDGVKVSNYGAGQGRGTRIIGNTITNCGDDGIDLFSQGRDAIVSGNVIRDCAFSAVKVMGPDDSSSSALGYLDGVSLVSNVIEGGRMGVLVKRSGHTSIVSNTIRGVDDECVLVNNTESVDSPDRVTISNNLLMEGDQGVRAEDPVGHISVSDNLIVDQSYRGVNDSDGSVEMLHIHGNLFDNIDGIAIENRSSAIVGNNVFENITDDWLYNHGASDTRLHTQVINGNNMTGANNLRDGTLYYDDVQNEMRGRVDGDTVAFQHESVEL